MSDKHDEEEDLLPSKTQIKKECDALQKTGEALIALKHEDLESMDLPDELLSAVMEARRLKSRGGLKRQRQYIGKLMREIDGDAVRAQLERLQHRHDVSNAAFKKTENWRDRLIGDDSTAVTQILDLYPGLDRQHLNQLVRQAKKEAREDRAPAAARKLFRYLREFIESSTPS